MSLRNNRGLRVCAAVNLLIAALILDGPAADAVDAAVLVDPSAGRDLADCSMANPCATVAFAISSRRATIL
jgi:hypothetical protein